MVGISKAIKVVWIGLVAAAIALPAVRIYSVNATPKVFRVDLDGNDFSSASGDGLPGGVVEVWYKQRSFVQGVRDSQWDPFKWCRWKNGGYMVMLGSAAVGRYGGWKVRNPGWLQLIPPTAKRNACSGGLYTEFWVRQWLPGGGVSDWGVPKVRWMRIKRPAANLGNVEGAIEGADWVAASIADGPNDGDEPGVVPEKDEDGLNLCDTPGFWCGKRVSWRCGKRGTFTCPTITVADTTNFALKDLEFPYVLGMITGHRPGGSVLAAAAAPRSPLGFAVNVNVRIKGLPNLGCDAPKFFDFATGLAPFSLAQDVVEETPLPAGRE